MAGLPQRPWLPGLTRPILPPTALRCAASPICAADRSCGPPRRSTICWANTATASYSPSLARRRRALPLPGESMVIGASIYAATTGKLDITGVIAAAIAGAIMGDNIGYVIGRWAGYPLLARFGSYGRADRTPVYARRYLFKTQAGRSSSSDASSPSCAPLSPCSHGQPTIWSGKTFLLWNALGGIVWSTLYGTGAYLLGDLVSRFRARSAWLSASSAHSASLPASSFYAATKPPRGKGGAGHAARG